MTRPGPRLAQGLANLARAIHPERSAALVALVLLALPAGALEKRFGPQRATFITAAPAGDAARTITVVLLGLTLVAAVRASGGMVGLNFATSFLRRDGKQGGDMGWEDVLAHLDHLIEKAGEDHVGLGSDFDGATLPNGIGDVAGLPNLTAAMEAHGYGKALMNKLTHENWLAVLERTWGA